MVAGWPGRVGRDGFGDYDMQDERLPEDPQRYVQAYQLNLQWWQIGAMGLIAPKFVIGLEPSDSIIRFAAFTWDQQLYINTDVFPSYLTYQKNSPGDYTFTFTSPVQGRPDEDGNPQNEVLAMQFGMADANDLSAQRLQAEVGVSGGLVFDVLVNQVGGGAVDPTVVVLAGF